jgi:hypothetical protein
MLSAWFGFLAFLAFVIGMFIVGENRVLGAILLGAGMVIQIMRTLMH